MGIFNNMFGNNGNPNPQTMVLGIFENLHNQGKISNEQYNSLMQNKNNPQEMINVLLQNGLVSNNQLTDAKQKASFFGIK